VDPTCDADSTEMAHFSLRNARFEEANTLYRIIATSRFWQEIFRLPTLFSGPELPTNHSNLRYLTRYSKKKKKKENK
jgi:hypothetical protein